MCASEQGLQFQSGSSLISLLTVTKVCGAFSSKILLFSSGGQLRAVTINYIVLGSHENSLMNISEGDVL